MLGVRFLAASLVTVLFAVPALAQDADADSRLARARRVAAEDAAAAAVLLRAVAADPAATPGQRVRGVRIAFELLPFEKGNEVAAELVLATLREQRSQPDAWQQAFRVRDRVMDGLDLGNGAPFLRSMIEIYPTQMRFRHYLAELYLDAGRPAEADALCMEILRQDPDDTQARRIQAPLRELEGRFEEARELYREIHEISGDLEPLAWRVAILIDSTYEYELAEREIDAALAAVDAAPAGRARNAVRARLEYERARLAEERARRARLLDIEERQDRLLFGVGAVWLVVLGGGLVLLRRRRLV